MTASLLFSQATFHSQPPHIDKGLMVRPLKYRSAVSKSYTEPFADTHDSFLNTFERISKDPKQNQQKQGVPNAKTALSPAYNPGKNFDRTSDPADTGCETGIPETTKQKAKNSENGESQISPALDLAAIMCIIEKLGLYDSAGGSNNVDNAYGIPVTAGEMADLKMFFDRLEQMDLVPTSEMKTNLYRSLQIFTNTQTDGASSNNDKNSLDGLGDARSTEIANLNQLNSIGQPKSFQSSENSPFASRSAIKEMPDAIKVAMENRLVGVEDSEQTKESSTLETVRTESIGLKKSAVTPAKFGAHIQENALNRVPPAIYSGKQVGVELTPQNIPNTKSSPDSKNTNDVQASKVIETVQRYGGEPLQNNIVQNESSPVSKMIHDAQLAKENHIRMEAAVGDEFNGKVSKMDTGSMDTGLLSSQHQTTEKAFEGTSISRQPNADPDNYRTQAIDQIVRKAFIHVRNGQHEAKIDLKPEFLGHVRMQVTTENHQVTVKILTEFGFVKDMVENHIHQLKADLQQQGLMVDKLEVAVSNDTNENKHPHEKSGIAKDRKRGTAHITPVSQEGELPEQAGGTGLRNDGKMTVDYFA